MDENLMKGASAAKAPPVGTIDITEGKQAWQALEKRNCVHNSKRPE